MHKLIGEWRVATDPVEKRFLHDLLESIRVDLAAAAAEAGGSDAAGLGVPGARTAVRSRVRQGLVCGSPFFSYYIIFFLINVLFFKNEINVFFRICVVNLILYSVFNSVNLIVF